MITETTEERRLFMWFWILLFIIPIIILAFLEEAIYFFVNRCIFGRSDLEKKCCKWLKQFARKIRLIT